MSDVVPACRAVSFRSFEPGCFGCTGLNLPPSALTTLVSAHAVKALQRSQEHFQEE